VLHIAGVVAEDPPALTFQRVNIDGTRFLVEEARRAGTGRFVFVSSLGAGKGRSDYHRSKHAAEQEVRRFPGRWLILRPGNVYGPGDEVISLLLKMVRTLPVVPVIGDGEQEFQPVWADDLGLALALAAERQDSGAVYELAGPERTTTNRLLDILAEITGKSPVRVPVPDVLAELGTGALERFGVDLLPVHRDQITMLQEGNVIEPPSENALTTVFGVDPVPLREGVEILADALPEQLPSEGVGELHRQRYYADILGSRLSAEDLITIVRRDFSSLTPDGTLEVGTEPGSGTRLNQGETVTLEIPVRGTMQVRVQDVEPDSVTLATLEGHHLAGVIRFQAAEHDGGRIRFEIVSFTRASTWLDWLGRTLGGQQIQKATWRSTVEAVVERSGGHAPDGVQVEEDVVEDAARIERWAEDLVMQRKRDEVE
jgi:nucleoside-diphosphate-sugar epimerase